MGKINPLLKLLGFLWFTLLGFSLSAGILRTGYVYGFRPSLDSYLGPALLALLLWGTPNFLIGQGIRKNKTWGSVIGIVFPIITGSVVFLAYVNSGREIPNFLFWYVVISLSLVLAEKVSR